MIILANLAFHIKKIFMERLGFFIGIFVLKRFPLNSLPLKRRRKMLKIYEENQLNNENISYLTKKSVKNNHNIAKISQFVENIFEIYRYSKSIIRDSFKLVEKKALNSFYYNSSKSKSVLSQCREILEMIKQKASFIVFRDNFIKSFEKLSLLSRKILYLKYIKERQVEQIAKVLKLSVRTYFRRLQDAEIAFAKAYTTLALS